MSNKSDNTGILTRKQREFLREKKIPRNIKWNLLDPKNGSLTNKIIELPEDFQIIFGSPHCWDFLTYHKITNSLNKLEGILSKFQMWYSVPTKRIKALSKNETRFYVVETIDITNFEDVPEEFLIENFADTKLHYIHHK